MHNKLFLAIEQCLNIVVNSETFRHYDLLVNQKPDWFADMMVAAETDYTTAAFIRAYETRSDYQKYKESHMFFKEYIQGWKKSSDKEAQLVNILNFLTLWDVFNGR